MMNPNRRLLSLDTLRGVDMFFIMGFSGLVTSLCALWPGSFTDMLASQMQHAAWNGLTIQDTIFPLFLFYRRRGVPLLAGQTACTRIRQKTDSGPDFPPRTDSCPVGNGL